MKEADPALREHNSFSVVLVPKKRRKHAKNYISMAIIIYMYLYVICAVHYTINL